MNTFSPNDFFDLSDTSVSELFKNIEYVWDAIAILPAYIKRILKPELLGDVEKGAWTEPGLVRLEKGSRVEQGAIIRGPTIIGQNTVVRSGAYIRGNVIIGNECLIGHGVEMRQTLVLNQSNLPHLNFVCTSLVGNRVKLGGNTHTANYRLDCKEIIIRVNVEGKKLSFPTGQTLFGSIIGDDAKTGGGVQLMPGTVVGKRTIIYPNCHVGGHLPHDSLVKPKAVTFEVIPQKKKGSL